MQTCALTLASFLDTISYWCIITMYFKRWAMKKIISNLGRKIEKPPSPLRPPQKTSCNWLILIWKVSTRRNIERESKQAYTPKLIFILPKEIKVMALVWSIWFAILLQCSFFGGLDIVNYFYDTSPSLYKVIN